MDFSDWVYGVKLKAYKRKHKLVKNTLQYTVTYITDLHFYVLFNRTSGDDG